MYDNPQITKARSKNFQLGIKEFFELSMLVGISEAIRLLSTYSSLRMKYSIFTVFKYFITLIETLTLFISAITPSLKQYTSFRGEIPGNEITLVDKEVSTNNSGSTNNPDSKESSNNSGKGKNDKFNE